MTLMRKILLNDFTMGLVMSLAKPQRAKQLVIRINAKRYFFSITFIDIGLGACLLLLRIIVV